MGSSSGDGDAQAESESAVQRRKRFEATSAIVLNSLGLLSPLLLLLRCPCQHIMTSKAQFYHKASDSQKEIMRPLLHNGLLLSEDAYWKQQRTLVSPGFHFWYLEEMVPIIVACMDGWCKKVEESLPVGQPDASVSLEMSHELATITLDSVATAAFGQGFRSDPARADRFIHSLKQVLDNMQARTLNLLGFIPLLKSMPFPSLRAIQQGCANIDAIVAEIVRDRKAGKSSVVAGGAHTGSELLKAQNAGEQVRRRDLLDLLLDAQANMPAGQVLTDRGVEEESINFIAAGAETTSNLCIWMLHRIVTEPGVFAKCRGEVDRVCGAEFSSIEMLKELKYLEGVAYEALRLHPPAPTIPKYCIEAHDMVLSGGRTIHVPKGTTMLLNANVIHRLPEYWPDPLTFRPERFLAGADMEQDKAAAPSPSASPDLGESSGASSGSISSSSSSKSLTPEEKARKSAQPFAYLGFSAGPRKCIGKNLAMIEIKIIFTLLLQRFEFSLQPGQYIAANPITRLPRNGIKFTVKRRSAPIQTEEEEDASSSATAASASASAEGVRNRVPVSVLKPLGMI